MTFDITMSGMSSSGCCSERIERAGLSIVPFVLPVQRLPRGQGGN